MRATYRQFLYALMMLALITAGISPACKFISGQSDGSMWCHPMMADADGNMPQHAPQPSRQKTDVSCSFCFAVQVSKDATVKSFIFSKISSDHLERAKFAYAEPILRLRDWTSVHTRAPPFFS